MIFLKLLKESFILAINSLIVNKLRTFLSLLGITIGIFAIISVFTVINALEDNIRESIASLGDDVVYIQKWPWSMGGNYPWWKYLKRPVPKLDEMKELQKRANKIEALCFTADLQRTIHYKNNFVENISITGATYDYNNVRSFEIERGRYFTPAESHLGKNLAIIGYTIAEDLFDGKNPIGKYIKIEGRKLYVIGVFKKQGEDMFQFSMDNTVLLPLNFVRTIVNIKNERTGPMIWAKPKKGIAVQEFLDHLRGHLRSIRKLRPKEEDNFALNRTSIISKGFDQLFVVIDLAGIIIGGFSILVGGFGIANIMFVSVKEQTKIIGIQKALGAKKHFILQQFLYEAITLSLIGGTLGLFLVFLLTVGAQMTTDMTFSLSINNITSGLSISVIIGVVSGFAPAYSAAKLDPVEAINSL